MFKSHVQEMMEARSETLRGFAEKTGLTQPTLIRARRDSKIGTCTLATLDRIARELGVEVKDLFSEINEKELNK